MGTWGIGIFSDDTACDVRDQYISLINEGNSVEEATKILINEWREVIEDPQEGTVFWLALAATQLKSEGVENIVKEKAIQIIEKGDNLIYWEDNPSLLKQRKAALQWLKKQLNIPTDLTKKNSGTEKIKRSSKNISYSVGDVFEIVLDESGNKGFGRILKLDKPSVFIELYKLKPQKVISIEDLTNTKPILQIWSTSVGLIKNDWRIVGNIPVPSDFKMPDFYKSVLFAEDKYDIISGDTEEIIKTVTLDGIGEAQPYGIFGDVAVKIRYVHELKKIGLY